MHFPGKEWHSHSSWEEAGWSTGKIKKAESTYKKIGSAALMVVHKGKVLLQWGNVSENYMCHTIRNSFLATLFGPHVENGAIDIEKTLEQLGIDDISPLSKMEKQARIIDLLKLRSGVYHTASYDISYMKRSRPQRNSHPPDTFWYYNIWDINVSGHIFEKETGKRVFDEFEERIAVPIEMQDYSIYNQHYLYEWDLSRIPAHPFVMSARDMARFGLLIVRKGNWNGKQIIPEKWIDKMLTSYSSSGPGCTEYGLMWWINWPDQLSDDYRSYSALGFTGHTVSIFPDLDVVIVHRMNSINGKRAPAHSIARLYTHILEAGKF